MATQLIDLDQVAASPWKNGGGSTRQLAIAPQGAGLDDFAWRISCAQVASAGPFSSFPGIQRSLALLAGNGLHLGREGGEATLVTCGQPVDFAGEEAITGTPLAGEVLDLNLLSRREDWQQSLRHWHLQGELLLSDEGEVRLLLCNAGALLARLADGREFALRARQALLLIDEPGGLQLRGLDSCLYLGLLRRRC